jgi:hypothetical protein
LKDAQFVIAGINFLIKKPAKLPQRPWKKSPRCNFSAKLLFVE